MLSDVEIRSAMRTRQIIIDPFPEDSDIQPASIDVHLGNMFGVLQEDVISKRLTAPSSVYWEKRLSTLLLPKQFMLAHIAERLTLNSRYVARIEGKSSIGRKGIAIHVTAGFVDPGWDGNLTIELFNASNIAYELHAGDAIAQFAFDKLDVRSERPYGHEDLNNHYQGSDRAVGSLETVS